MKQQRNAILLFFVGAALVASVFAGRKGLGDTELNYEIESLLRGRYSDEVRRQDAVA